MADEASMSLDEFLRKVQVSSDADFLREGVRTLAQSLQVSTFMPIGICQLCRRDLHSRLVESGVSVNAMFTGFTATPTRGNHCPLPAYGEGWSGVALAQTKCSLPALRGGSR